MNIKEKITKKAIQQLEKKSEKLNALIYANPINDVISARQSAAEIIKEHQGDSVKISKLLEPLAVKEKNAFELHERQMKNSSKWCEELAKVDFDLGQLKTELYYIEQRAI